MAIYWNEYKEQIKALENQETNTISIQEAIVSAPTYETFNRNPRKYTDELDKRLEEVLLQERKKNSLLGSHKQNLTKLQIHEILTADGFDISYSTIAVKINEKINKTKECFIRQLYEYGDRLESKLRFSIVVIGT